jgi:predicted RNase H-like HicB family nuclease
MALDRKFVIVVEWDEEAGVWFVDETDVPGLAAEADTLDDLVDRLKRLVPELLELNGVVPRDSHLSRIPFSVMVNKLQSAPLH